MENDNENLKKKTKELEEIIERQNKEKESFKKEVLIYFYIINYIIYIYIVFKLS